MIARRLACVCAVTGALCTGGQRASTQVIASFADALTYYDLGAHDAVARGMRASIAGDPDRVIPMLARDAEGWIAAGDAPDSARRRRVAAVFALELGLAGVDTQWEITTQAVEWACAMLRRAGPPAELERQWHLAALALIEGGFEPISTGRPQALALGSHIRHVEQRFPKEPRLLLARALGAEFEFWYHRLNFSPDRLIDYDNTLAGDAITALQAAAAHPDTRAEARLRVGVLEYHRGHGEAALPHLEAAAQGGDDPTRTYLAHLVSGWIHEKAGRRLGAIPAYRRSLAAVNGLSAALGLAVQLYADEARDEADALVTAALAAGVDDPWKQYGYGDFRRLPQLLARLREGLRQ